MRCPFSTAAISGRPTLADRWLHVAAGRGTRLAIRTRLYSTQPSNQPGVGEVTQAIAKEIRRQDRQRDRGTRKDHQPPRRLERLCEDAAKHPQLRRALSVWEAISSASVESTVNQVVSKRMVKKQQMRWTPEGAHLVLQPALARSMAS
jgi:hypothetical protein